jgi:hypothetical protein
MACTVVVAAANTCLGGATLNDDPLYVDLEETIDEDWQGTADTGFVDGVGSRYYFVNITKVKTPVDSTYINGDPVGDSTYFRLQADGNGDEDFTVEIVASTESITAACIMSLYFDDDDDGEYDDGDDPLDDAVLIHTF